MIIASGLVRRGGLNSIPFLDLQSNPLQFFERDSNALKIIRLLKRN